MKKILLLSLLGVLGATNVYADALETHINDSVKSLGKMLDGKKGKVVLGTFTSSKAGDTCTPNKGVNTKISAALTRAGVKTTIASRTVALDADQAEISRVTKLSGGSYIILGSYEVNGTKFKMDCTVYDHNGSGIGACEDLPAVAIDQAAADNIACPKDEKAPAVKPLPDSDIETDASTDAKVKEVDDYICSVIHKEYDLKRLVQAMYEKKFFTLDELKGVKKESAEDALEVKKDYCVTLGNFVVCSDYWQGTGAQVFLGESTGLGASKILSWKHPNKASVKDAKRCLKKDNNWWNP